MNKADIENPFVVGRYVSDKYFCDREKETAFLIKQIENGRNVALISQRRMGKSGLILHTFAQRRLKDNYNTFYLDIYATNSLSEFVYLFGKAIFEQLKGKKTKWIEQFFRVMESLRVGFKVNPITGEPSLDLGIGDIKSPETTLDEIFSYIENSDRKCVIAIDEFQKIGDYREKNVEALLRTKIQTCTKAQFIFAGSERHLMAQMFNSAAKPFYQSAISMGLDAIDHDVYSSFAQALFRQGGKEIDSKVISLIYNEFDGITWFVQMMMNELYDLTAPQTVCTLDSVDAAKRNVILVQEYSYRELLMALSIKQRQLLQALAKERRTQGLTSATFINKYKLGSASSVQAAVKPLLSRDIVVKDADGYRIYDYFFAEWIRMTY